MKKRMTFHRFYSLGIGILMAYICFFHLNADNRFFPCQDESSCSSSPFEDNVLYSLDEPLDFDSNKQFVESQEIKSDKDVDSNQLFYPNLFQNNPFVPNQGAHEETPVAPTTTFPSTTVTQPSAETVSKPEQLPEKTQTPVYTIPKTTLTPVVKTPEATQPVVQPAPVATPPATSLPPTATPPVPPVTPAAPTAPSIVRRTTPVAPNGSPAVTQTPAVPPTASTAPAAPTQVPAAPTPAQQALQQSPILQSPTQPVPPATGVNAETINNINTQAGAAAPGTTTRINAPNPGAPVDNQKTILINFNNVAITEYIRFISRIANKNFVFDENDLQFTVTIVSEEPTTIDNIMTALLQELRIHDLEFIEQDNTIIIHRNSRVSAISRVVTENESVHDVVDVDLVTKVFRLNTLEADRAAIILKPMVSATALVEVLKQTNHLIITDLASNVREITNLLNSLDSPQSGMVIGQYVARTQPIDSLIAIASRIIEPIAQDQKITFIPHRVANSIFVVSNPYLVERTISILKYLDQTATSTQILNPKDLNFPQMGVEGQWVLDKNGNWQFIPNPPNRRRDPPSWKLENRRRW